MIKPTAPGSLASTIQRALWIIGVLLFVRPVVAEPEPLEVFDQVWQAARAAIYPEALVTSHFTETAFTELRKRAGLAHDIDELRPIINDFLDTLGVSHTQFYTSSELDYYFFRSLFSTRDINTPIIGHLGYQEAALPGLIREVLDGLPADRAGLRRGDRLLHSDGAPVNQVDACRRPGASERAYPFQLQRNGQLIEVTIACVFQNPNASLRDAMENSARRIELGQRRVGYLRLWSGTHETILESYLKLINSLADTDALILDLRGGFGGAWYEYLDPFYPNRDSYYHFTVLNREGRDTFEAGDGDHENSYPKPLIVLINEGVRSGKEALAFQFRESGRALVIGSETAGYF